jgi:hypothetical protein
LNRAEILETGESSVRIVGDDSPQDGEFSSYVVSIEIVSWVRFL